VARKPVLLTVEDDPAVSRAIARDLRRRYGEDHRVVRAQNGVEALEALRELTVRGEATALVMADYRMPGMTGIDLLEQAMDVVPGAKRVLLTAYADTDAAIRAVNDVDLDHYLLKPWNPPEERLYPVLDELIEQVDEVHRLTLERCAARASIVPEKLLTPICCARPRACGRRGTRPVADRGTRR
jgi:thioredoxin reductase (NADPH)